MERPVPRTLLERLIQESDRTLEETCEDFERCARETNERGATLSVRQLGRWMAGQVDNARPASRRVARHLWGRSFKELLGPPEVSTKVVSSEGDSALARVGAEDHADQMAPARVDSALAVAADESARFVAWAEAENVGELTLEQLHAEIRRISHAYLKVPTGPLFVRTRELRDRTFRLLEGRQRPSRAREIYSAAGWSLTVLAWMSIDLGLPHAAEDHARAALLCAERAERPELRAWVRATQHTAAFWQDDFLRAAQYAADGLRYATGSSKLFLASAYALDLARSGRDEQAWAALRTAQEIAEDNSRASDELAGPFTCAIDRASGLWSDVQLALGAAVPALDHADRAVDSFEVLPQGQRNSGSERMVRLQKVRAHLVLGQLDEAEAALTPLLATPPEHRVSPLLRRMNDVSSTVLDSQHRTAPVALRIREVATAFSRVSAGKTRELST